MMRKPTPTNLLDDILAPTVANHDGQTWPIANVKVGARLRALDPVKVAELAGAIGELGILLQPIVITPSGRLVAGNHRLHACKQLGWAHIPVIIVPLDDNEAELAEIDENLRRNELTVLEQAEHLHRREEILSARGQRAMPGLQPKGGGAPGAPPPPTTTQDLAAGIGLSVRTTQERLQIARHIAPDVRTQIRTTETAQSTKQLIDLARQTPERQRTIADMLVRGDAANVNDAVTKLTPPLPAGAVAPSLRSAPVSRQINYDGDEWYTPSDLLASARYILTGAHHKPIDLDPATSEDAQEIVAASRYFTKADNGLAADWTADTVWLNPPYSSPAPWVEKLLVEFEAKHFQTALLLVNNATDTAWFHQLLNHPGVVPAFLRKRLTFWRQNYTESTAARQGQVLVFLGSRLGPAYKRFHNHVIDQWGCILWPAGKMGE